MCSEVVAYSPNSATLLPLVNISFVCFSAIVRCPTLNVPFSILNTTDSNFLTAVQVVCNAGYSMDPLNLLNNTINTVCKSSGNWSTYPIICQRKSIVYVMSLSYVDSRWPSGLRLCTWLRRSWVRNPVSATFLRFIFSNGYILRHRIHYVLQVAKPDVVCITETWLTSSVSDNLITNDIFQK